MWLFRLSDALYQRRRRNRDLSQINAKTRGARDDDTDTMLDNHFQIDVAPHNSTSFTDAMKTNDVESLLRSASLHKALGMDKNMPFSEAKCTVSLSVSEPLTLSASATWLIHSRIKTASMKVVFEENDYWIVVNSNGMDDDESELSDEDMNSRAFFNASVMKFFYKKRGTHQVLCTHHSGRIRCDSLSRSIKLLFEFLEQFSFRFTFVEIEQSTTEFLDAIFSQLGKLRANIDKLRIEAFVHPSHAKIIDIAYKNGCNVFEIRHVRQIDDVRKELSIECLLRSALFKVIFGENEDAYLRYESAVQAIRADRLPYNEIVCYDHETSELLKPLVLLELEDEDLANFGHHHQRYTLLPYIKKRVISLPSAYT